MSKGGAAEALKAEAAANIHWFTVRYGADQTQLFNLDCWGQARRHPHAAAATAERAARARATRRAAAPRRCCSTTSSRDVGLAR